MKFVLTTIAVFCAVLVLSNAYSVSSPFVFKSKCSHRNPLKGPEAVVREIALILPYEKIAQIVAKHASDPDVQSVVNYTTSDDFKKPFKSLQESPEFRAGLKFICKKMYFDYNIFLKVINKALNITVDPYHELFLTKSVELFNVGAMVELFTFQTMWDEIDAVLPKDRIYAIIHLHEAHDWYYQEAMRQAKSDEYVRLVEAVAALPEYKQISDGFSRALHPTALIE